MGFCSIEYRTRILIGHLDLIPQTLLIVERKKKGLFFRSGGTQK